jgi:hypothetical protein
MRREVTHGVCNEYLSRGRAPGAESVRSPEQPKRCAQEHPLVANGAGPLSLDHRFAK